MFSFIVDTVETAIKTWHETSKVDPRVFFLLDKEKTQTDKYAPMVNIDKVWCLLCVLFNGRLLISERKIEYDLS